MNLTSMLYFRADDLRLQAKDAAKFQDKWFLVNVQSTKEFSSHMVLQNKSLSFSLSFEPFCFGCFGVLTLFWLLMKLNRDTWANEAVAQTISSNFIFWQVCMMLALNIGICIIVFFGSLGIFWLYKCHAGRHGFSTYYFLFFSLYGPIGLFTEV